MEEKKYMTPNELQQPYIEEENDFNLLGGIRKLVKNWKFILKWGGIAAIVGLVAAFSAVSTFTSTSKLAPESSSKSSGSSTISSLASLAGISLGSMSSSDAISPDLYPDIVTSTPFLTDLFYMPVKAKYKKEEISCNYYEYLSNCQKMSWYEALLKIPVKVIGFGYRLIGPKGEKTEVEKEDPKGFRRIGLLDSSRLTEAQEDVLRKMKKNILVVVDKKTSIISVTVTDQNPEIAKQLTDNIIAKLKDYITKYRTEKAREDLKYYEHLYDKAKEDYYNAQKLYAAYSDANQGLVRQSVMVELDRLQNESDLMYSLYNSCAQQVQVAKAQVQHETPVVTVITPSSVPLRDNESGAKTLAIWFFLGVFFASMWLLFGEEFMAKVKGPDNKE